MTDYDFLDVDVKRLETCDRCWPLMALAMRVLTTSLRKDFGFEHLLWVYSGRRGIHCWVCDKRARSMSNEARAAVAEYFSVYKGTDASGTVKRVSLTTPLHPSLKRAYDDVLAPYWTDTILPNQGLLEDEKFFEPILAMIPDANIRDEFASQWKSGKKFATSACPDESVARSMQHALSRPQPLATAPSMDEKFLDVTSTKSVLSSVMPM